MSAILENLSSETNSTRQFAGAAGADGFTRFIADEFPSSGDDCIAQQDDHAPDRTQWQNDEPHKKAESEKSCFSQPHADRIPLTII
jgi:hypothetical protein